MVLLVFFIFVFIIIYQRRVINHLTARQHSQTEKQREALHAISESYENEHRSVAAGLHHNVGKVLSTINLNLHRLEKQHTLAMGEPSQLNELLVQTRELSEEASIEVHNIIRIVQPPLLADFGLVAAIADLCTKINESTYWQVSFQYNDSHVRLKSDAEFSLYRIIQELFSNAMRHSGATHIVVSLHRTPEEIMLVFTDNGAGFDRDEIYRLEPRKRYGFTNLESRIELMSGSLQLDTYSKGGTRVEIKLNAKLIVL
jgi:signal transduction histidine kinase